MFFLMPMPWLWISANTCIIGTRHEQELNQHTLRMLCACDERHLGEEWQKASQHKNTFVSVLIFAREYKTFHKRCPALTEFCSRSEVRKRCGKIFRHRILSYQIGIHVFILLRHQPGVVVNQFEQWWMVAGFFTRGLIKTVMDDCRHVVEDLSEQIRSTSIKVTAVTCG